ncbi:hypothetical protein LIA77_05258 [Sarocladium implicatum]|nr:hypothetical protein LIA77_05258 [Sarocladium implicatum]
MRLRAAEGGNLRRRWRRLARMENEDWLDCGVRSMTGSNSGGRAVVVSGCNSGLSGLSRLTGSASGYPPQWTATATEAVTTKASPRDVTMTTATGTSSAITSTLWLLTSANRQWQLLYTATTSRTQDHCQAKVQAPGYYTRHQSAGFTPARLSHRPPSNPPTSSNTNLSAFPHPPPANHHSSQTTQYCSLRPNPRPRISCAFRTMASHSPPKPVGIFHSNRPQLCRR